MNAQLKPLVCFLVGLLALIGLGGCTLAGCISLFFGVPSIKGYMGKESAKSHVSTFLPLPPQSEEEMPMALEKQQFFAESGIIIFRASPEWQETFHRFYPAEELKDAWMAEGVAVDWSADLEDDRIHYFVKDRRWHRFHSGRMRGQNFSALRDESGEFLLVYFYKP